jgi:hypothetical protein
MPTISWIFCWTYCNSFKSNIARSVGIQQSICTHVQDMKANELLRYRAPSIKLCVLISKKVFILLLIDYLVENLPIGITTFERWPDSRTGKSAHGVHCVHLSSFNILVNDIWHFLGPAQIWKSTGNQVTIWVSWLRWQANTSRLPTICSSRLNDAKQVFVYFAYRMFAMA